MNNSELVEILKAANLYLSRLKSLDEELDHAIVQINTTFQDTVRSITDTFSLLKENLIQVLENREKVLLDQALKVKSQGLDPLEACKKIISDKIDSTHLLITAGNSVKNGKLEDPTKFSKNASLLGSLPEIPDLKDVPFLTFCYEPSVENEAKELLNEFGFVCRIAPVQVICKNLIFIYHSQI